MSNAETPAIGPPVELGGGMNVEAEQVRDQVAENIRRGLPQLRPYPKAGKTVSLAAGGPSLETHFPRLEKAWQKGQKVVAMNATHDWLLDRDVRPSVQVIVDARACNARFVTRPIETCKYFLASQCHPSLFEALRDFDVTVIHVSGHDVADILKDYYLGNYLMISSGCTVALTAITLMKHLGYPRQEIFGLDSCAMDGRHHAYEQPENDGQRLVPMIPQPGSETYLCAGWMAKQAYDFQALVYHEGDHYELKVHGDGLIAGMMRTGSRIHEQQLKGAD
jgi:hypothetical protein